MHNRRKDAGGQFASNKEKRHVFATRIKLLFLCIQQQIFASSVHSVSCQFHDIACIEEKQPYCASSSSDHCNFLTGVKMGKFSADADVEATQ